MFSEYQKKTIKASMVSNVAALNLMRLKKEKKKISFLFRQMIFLPYLVNIIISCCWLHCGDFLHDPN